METGPSRDEPAAVDGAGKERRVEPERMSLEELLYYVLVGDGRQKREASSAA